MLSRVCRGKELKLNAIGLDLAVDRENLAIVLSNEHLSHNAQCRRLNGTAA